MTWRIIKRGWEGCDSLSDTRLSATYVYGELDGAKFIRSNDEGEVCFELVDKRTAWLMSTDLETGYPLQDGHIRETTTTKEKQ